MLFPIPLDYGIRVPVIPWDLGLYERVAEVRMIEEPIKKEPTVPELIKIYSDKYGFDSNVALRIAKCESGFRNVKNKNSSASGIYQQLARFRPARAKKYGREGASVFDIEANIDVSIQMMKYESTRHRNPSRHCRGK